MSFLSIVDIFLIKSGRVLLVQQQKRSAYGLWSLPGGHVEAGEPPRAAIKREVLEELGVVIKQVPKKNLFFHIEQKTSEGDLGVTTFIADWPGGPLAIQDSELMGYGWFTLEEVSQMAPYLRSPWILPVAEKFKQRLKPSPAQNQF